MTYCRSISGLQLFKSAFYKYNRKYNKVKHSAASSNANIMKASEYLHSALQVIITRNKELHVLKNNTKYC
jgi:hypothetical protein